MYKTSIQEHSFDIVLGDKMTVNDELSEMEFRKGNTGSYILKLNGQSKEADLISIDKENKLVSVRIEGKKYVVKIKEPIDILLDTLGINTANHKKINHLKAPMPGLVIKIVAAKGEHVKAGEPLLILEAMKMENVFKAPVDVIIKDILIDEKQSVEKGAVLMVFE